MTTTFWVTRVVVINTQVWLYVLEFLVFEFYDSVTSMTQIKGIDKNFFITIRGKNK